MEILSEYFGEKVLIDLVLLPQIHFCFLEKSSSCSLLCGSLLLWNVTQGQSFIHTVGSTTGVSGKTSGKSSTRTLTKVTNLIVRHKISENCWDSTSICTSDIHSKLSRRTNSKSWSNKPNSFSSSHSTKTILTIQGRREPPRRLQKSQFFKRHEQIWILF